MRKGLVPLLSALWISVIVLFTVEITIVSLLRYFTKTQTPPEIILANAYAHPYLIIHVIGGMIALVLGPLQFVPWIRNRLPALHRVSGRIYVAACAIGAPAGFMLALGTIAGPIASIGFAIPALLWPVFTYLGVRCAMERRIEEHRRWMLRSYAITANAITLRILLPAAGLLGFEFLGAYRIIAWLGWVVNLALVELYMRRSIVPQSSESQLASA